MDLVFQVRALAGQYFDSVSIENMNHLRAIVLAAGKGVRMKSQTPKVLHPVCGKPMIQHVLDHVRKLGSLKILVVLGREKNRIAPFLGSNTSVIVQKKPLGTADAVKSCAASINSFAGDILILCGDTPLLTTETFEHLIAKHRQSKASCTFLTAMVPEPKNYGRVIRNQDGAVLAIREDSDLNDEQKGIKEINVGVYCFKSSGLFNALKFIKKNPKKKEFYLTDIIDILTSQGKKVDTCGLENFTEAIGINTREDLAQAESILRKRILGEWMQKGVTIVDPDKTYIDASVKIGPDTMIHPFTIIDADVKIGSRCTIGPFCHIRPKTTIGNDVYVGNFTEISRTTLGDNCFMKHFSYLGDARVGKRVNIGAGVVTANFDGKMKHDTHISDDAFIGSDSILIAPLHIGRKSMTAAGSVVPKRLKIPDASVVMGVPAKVVSRKKNK